MKPFQLVLALVAIPVLGFSEESVIAGPVPLDARAKFLYHAERAYGPLALVGAAASSGLRQQRDSPDEWGQGVSGYGKRLGSTLAYAGIRNGLAFGLDATLHQDPRYTRSLEKGFWNRTGHAIRGTILTHKDSGGETFATWRVGSAYGAAFLANQWYPDRFNTVESGFRRGSIQLGFDLIGRIGSEFWPDVKSKILH